MTVGDTRRLTKQDNLYMSGGALGAVLWESLWLWE